MLLNVFVRSSASRGAAPAARRREPPEAPERLERVARGIAAGRGADLVEDELEEPSDAGVREERGGHRQLELLGRAPDEAKAGERRSGTDPDARVALAAPDREGK